MKRRSLLAAAALGGIGAIAAGGIAQAAPVATTTGASRPDTAAAPAVTDPATVEPAGGAGLFDVDPDQGSVSQSPTVVVVGDISVMPEDWGF